MLNSGLKTFYISVSFTRYCSHSYLCKPKNLEPAYLSQPIGRKGPIKKSSLFGEKMLRLINSANGSDAVLNYYSKQASELKKEGREGGREKGTREGKKGRRSKGGKEGREGEWEEGRKEERT